MRAKVVVLTKQAKLLPLQKQILSLPPPPPPPPPPIKSLIKLFRSDDNNNNEQGGEDYHLLIPFISTPSLPLLLPRLGNSTKAIKFLQWIRNNNNSPSLLPQTHSILYQAIFQLTSTEEKDPHFKLLQIFQNSKHHNVALTLHSATILITHFAKTQMITESLDVFNYLHPSLKTTHLYNTLLSILYQSNQILGANKLLDEMLHPHSLSPPNSITGSLVFSAVNGEELIDLVSKFSRYGVFPDSSVLNTLITNLSKGCNVEKAWELLHTMMKMNASLVKVESINAMLVGLARGNKFEEINLLIAEMKENGVAPNGKTFEIPIHRLCKLHRVDEALQVLENIKEIELGSVIAIPDIVTYVEIIKELCNVGRLDESLAMVDQMRLEHGHTPNVVIYNTLIYGFCKAGEIENSLKLFDQMVEEGVTPDVMTLNTLVFGMCKCCRIRTAFEFFNDMQSKGLKGNASTYTYLITAFCKVNNLDHAMHMFNEMVSSHCTPDRSVYYTLIEQCSKAGRLDDALSVLSKMKSAGFSPNVVIYRVLISGFCKKKKLDKVYELIKEMEMSGIKPDQIIYNTLIASLTKSGDFSTVDWWMKKMADQGFVPDVVTYGALIHGYCKAGKLDKALEIFSLMGSTTKVPPNTIVYNILIDALCKKKKIEDALSLMDDMKVKGVNPDFRTYRSMFKVLQDMNHMDKAFNLMDDMNKLAIYPDRVIMEILTCWLSEVGETARLRRFVDRFEGSNEAS